MMVPVQILDGLAAGILGVAVPSFIVSLLRGSGHVNAGQSVVMLMQGAGAAMSPALTGSIAGHYSYATAFGVLSVIAIVARRRERAVTYGTVTWGERKSPAGQQPPAARLTCEWR